MLAIAERIRLNTQEVIARAKASQAKSTKEGDKVRDLTPLQIANRQGLDGRRSEMFFERLHGVHVGRRPMTVEQLAWIPTSLLMTDIARHDCARSRMADDPVMQPDRTLARAPGCVYCEVKQDELDRRIPSRFPPSDS